MGVFSSFLASLFIVATMQGAAEVNETPAEPIRRTVPDYPAACIPESGIPKGPQTVTVKFDISKEGITDNVRIVESDDACFNDTVIATVRSWNYYPRRVDGFISAQPDTETTFTFIFEESTQAVDFDARVIYREPPKYPDRCQWRADNREWVQVEFDIDTDGIPQHIEAIESTNSCFEKASITAVSKWRYRPKTVSGMPVVRTGVRTTIVFELANDTSPEMKYRVPVHYRLLRAQRLLDRGKYEQAMDVLDKTEEKFGDSFSRVELSAFLRLRAGVRIELGDYAGALDDLRVVRDMGLGDQANEAVGNMILQLEAALAAEESTAQEADNEAEPSQ